jgi:hypothetical protein
MLRCTVTDVAWSTLAQPTAAAAVDDAVADGAAAGEDAAADVVEADDGAPAAATEETVAEPHPARAEHSSTASTGPRTSRGDIMLL